MISFILYTLAVAHGSVANGIRMVGNELQLLVNNNAMVGINTAGMTVAGRVAGQNATANNQFVTKEQLNSAIFAGGVQAHVKVHFYH